MQQAVVGIERPSCAGVVDPRLLDVEVKGRQALLQELHEAAGGTEADAVVERGKGGVDAEVREERMQLGCGCGQPGFVVDHEAHLTGARARHALAEATVGAAR